MQSVDPASGTVEYHESGRAGPVLVFLTGVFVGVTVWRRVLADLRADHRCIAVEMPLGAHRRPMNPDADLSSRGLAGLVAEFLTALDLADVTLVGCDWGGAQLVAAHGLDDRVGRLVLLPQESFDNFPPGLPGRSLYRRARLTEIPDSYVLIPEDQPAACAREIREFVATT